MAFAAVLALLVLQALACCPGAVQLEEPSRGRLLYDTLCNACHIKQLQWSDDDIEAVARHLNDSIHRHSVPARTTGRAPVASALPPPA